MSYSQVVPFDQSAGGHTPNFCLANVCAGYGIPNKYASAWQAWLNTEQHPLEQPPEGLDVPVFFSYTATIDGVNQNWGHIGVRLADGQFWSDGHLYPSIEAYTANHYPKYVGWGESINNVKVIGADMSDVIDANVSRILTHGIIGRNGLTGRSYSLDGSHGGDDLVGRELTAALIQEVFGYPESADWRDGTGSTTVSGINAQLATIPVLQKQVADLQASQTKQVNVDANVTVTPATPPATPAAPLTPDQTAAASGIISWIKKLLGIKG